MWLFHKVIKVCKVLKECPSRHFFVCVFIFGSKRGLVGWLLQHVVFCLLGVGLKAANVAQVFRICQTLRVFVDPRRLRSRPYVGGWRDRHKKVVRQCCMTALLDAMARAYTNLLLLLLKSAKSKKVENVHFQLVQCHGHSINARLQSVTGISPN